MSSLKIILVLAMLALAYSVDNGSSNNVLTHYQLPHSSEEYASTVLDDHHLSTKRQIGVASETECVPEPCEGRPTKMKFLFTRRECSESSNAQGPDKFICEDFSLITYPAYIVVTSKSKSTSNGKGKGGKGNGNGTGGGDSVVVYFEGVVKWNEIFTVSNHGEQVSADMMIQFFNVIYPNMTTKGPDLKQQLTYHSSCSQSLSLNDTFGSVRLVEFTNDVQGTVCCVPPTKTPTVKPTVHPTTATFSPTVHPTHAPTDHPKTAEPSSSPSGHPSQLPSTEPSSQPSTNPSVYPSDLPSVEPSSAPSPPCNVIPCTNRPTYMLFKLTGEVCSASLNEQPPDKFTCSDLAPIQYPVYVVVRSTSSSSNRRFLKNGKGGGGNGGGSSNGNYFSGIVPQTGDLIPIGNGSKVDANMILEVYSENKTTLYQTLQYHSSCSQSLSTGDTFGAFKLIGFTNENQDVVCFE